MNGLERPPRAAWYRLLRPKLGKYDIKERPKSWAPGNYRKLRLLEEDINVANAVASRTSMPPVPPIRSPLTRLQTVQHLTTTEPTGSNNTEENAVTQRAVSPAKTLPTKPFEEDITLHGYHNENGTGNGIQEQKKITSE